VIRPRGEHAAHVVGVFDRVNVRAAAEAIDLVNQRMALQSASGELVNVAHGATAFVNTSPRHTRPQGAGDGIAVRDQTTNWTPALMKPWCFCASAGTDSGRASVHRPGTVQFSMSWSGLPV
jgi:hypothetical protein